MNISNDQTGYKFNDKELSQIEEVLKRMHTSTGIDISYGIGESRGFAAAMVGINDQSLSYKSDVVLLQSYRNPSGVVMFGVLAAADREPLSADSFFATLLEALAVADVFLRRFIDGLIAKQANEQRASNSASVPAFNTNVISSKVLTPDEVHYVQSFANELGKLSGLQGFAKFIEPSAGITSIALGVMSKEMPIMLGTVVAVSDETGMSCTVRDFQNRPMPGPDSYGTIYSALVTTRPSFEKLSQLTAKHVRPSLWRKLFG